MNNRDPLPQLDLACATKRFKATSELDPCSCVPASIWNDPNTVVESKLDGHRFRLHVGDGVNRLDSRRPSVNGGLFVEKTDNVPHIRDFSMPELVGTVFDGELCAGRDSNDVAHALGSLATQDERSCVKYVVFDILFYKGRDVRMSTDRVRRELLELCFKKTTIGTHPMFELMKRPRSMTPDEKKSVLVKALARGEEGVMIKDLSKPYGQGWAKVKREARYDVVVMGYDEPEQFSLKKGDVEPTETKFYKLGWVGAVKFGQFRDGKLAPFGQTSGMSDDVRKEISENREACIGRVFEIAAQERFSSGKFRHPRFIRWRDGEKLAKDCIYRVDEV